MEYKLNNNAILLGEWQGWCGERRQRVGRPAVAWGSGAAPFPAPRLGVRAQYAPGRRTATAYVRNRSANRVSRLPECQVECTRAIGERWEGPCRKEREQWALMDVEGAGRWAGSMVAEEGKTRATDFSIAAIMARSAAARSPTRIGQIGLDFIILYILLCLLTCFYIINIDIRISRELKHW